MPSDWEAVLWPRQLDLWCYHGISCEHGAYGWNSEITGGMSEGFMGAWYRNSVGEDSAPPYPLTQHAPYPQSWLLGDGDHLFQVWRLIKNTAEVCSARRPRSSLRMRSVIIRNRDVLDVVSRRFMFKSFFCCYAWCGSSRGVILPCSRLRHLC